MSPRQDLPLSVGGSATIQNITVRMRHTLQFYVVSQLAAGHTFIFVPSDQRDRTAIPGLGIAPLLNSADLGIVCEIQFLCGGIQQSQVAFVQLKLRTSERIGAISLQARHGDGNAHNYYKE